VIISTWRSTVTNTTYRMACPRQLNHWFGFSTLVETLLRRYKISRLQYSVFRTSTRTDVVAILYSFQTHFLLEIMTTMHDLRMHKCDTLLTNFHV
jgi:hypothetical protein